MSISQKPNILFFFTDDQRYDTMGVTGNTEIKTPNLDRFANDCAVFTHAHIMGGSSGAVCMPSRAMIQTGRLLFSLHDKGKKAGSLLPPEHVTMPEHLKANGYYTHHIGKWHQDKLSFTRSYDDASTIVGMVDGLYCGNMGGHFTPALFDFDPSGEYASESAYTFDENYNRHSIGFDYGGKHTTDVFCDSAIKFIDEYEKDKPFYLYLATRSPHDPRNAPEEYSEMYNSETVATPKNFMPRHPFDNGDLYNRDEKLEWFPRTKRAIRQHIADYYSMIAHVDDRFGDVIKSLKKKGLYDNTIIIYAGDNGLALGQHGLMGKQSVYDHSVRVPFMIKMPNSSVKFMNDSYIYLADIFPTICEICGIEIPDSVDSKSFLEILKDSTTTTRDSLFLAYRNLQRSYKDKEYKLIEYYVEGSRHTQLFNLEKDPCEMQNLAECQEYSDILAEMRQKLAEAQLANNDPLVTMSEQEMANYLW